jgi:GAF domain-containing protein
MALGPSVRVSAAIRDMGAKTRDLVTHLLYDRTILSLAILFCAGVGATLWHFSELSSTLVSTMGLLGLGGLALVIERMRFTSAELAQRVAELTAAETRLATLHEINLAVTSTLDLDATLKVLMEKIDAFLPYSAVQIWLKNQTSGVLERAACRNLDEADWKGRKLRGTPPLVKEAIATKAAVVAHNLQTDPRTLDPEFYRKQGFISYLGAPMVAKGEVLGVLVCLTGEERHFTTSDVEFLSSLAGQAAIAIHNSELYEQTTKQAVELENSNEAKDELLEVMARLARSLTETLDMTAVGERIVVSVQELVGVKVATLRLLEPDGSLRVLASSGEPFSESPAGESVSSGMGLTSRALTQQRTVWCADMLEDPEVHLTDQMRDYQLRSGNRSIIAVPLRAHEKMIGALALLDRTGRIYSKSEVALIQTFADQAALALENARLLEEAVRRAQEQGALNIVANALSQSLDRDELLKIALDKVLEATRRERVSIRLKDPATGVVTLVAHRGFSQEEIEDLLRRTRHQATEQVLASGQPMVVNNRQELQNTQSLLPLSFSVAWIPIRAGARVVGVLGISAGSPVPFSQREVEFLQAIGNVIGVALENARLFQETERRNRELQSLYTVTSTVTQSLDINILMQTALETTINVLSVDAGRLYVFDGKINALRLAAHWGISEDQLRGIGHYLPGEGVIGRIFVENRPFVFADVETDPNYQAMARGQLANRGGYRSVAGLPITVKDSPIGVIYVYGRLPRNFTREEMGLFSTIGGQIGVALENARLFEESQKNLRRIRALREIDQAITSTLNLHDLLKVFLEKIDHVLPYSASSVRLFNPGNRLLEPIACRNLDENEWKAESWRGGRGLPSVVFENKAPLIVRNLQSDPRLRDPQFFRKHALVSYLGVPLFVRDDILGVLSFYTKEDREFTSEEVEFLSTLASQAAMAIHNSQLYEQTRKQAVELEDSNEAKDELLEAMARQKEELSRLNAGLHREIAERTKARAEIAAKNRDLETLHEIGQIILTSPDLETTLEKILHHALAAGACDIGTIRLLDSKTQTLEPVAHSGYRNSDHVNAHHRNLKEATSGRLTLAMLTEARPRIVENVQEGEGLRTFKKEGVQSAVVVPVRNQDKVLGALQLGSRAGGKFQPEQIRFLEAIGNQMGIAVEKARLFDEIKKQTLELEKSNKTKDELLAAMASQKGELFRLNAGLHHEIAERTKARAEIAAKNRDLETLLYVTSHDLREPLRAIENFSRIVNDRYGERLDEKGQDFLRRVIQGSQRLTRLLDDILMLSRSQRMSVPTEAVAGETIVQEALKRLEGKVSATNAQVHVAPEFGGLRVDKTWATQAIYNLLVNALKFTRDGEAPDVEIAPYSPEGSGSGVVGIAVRDRGPGVAPEHAERIFQLFQRAVGREIEGTGAGLAIVRQIAERHGGHAWVQPRDGGGSQFVITFGQSKGVQGGGRNEC